jgi:hypothetical protein
MNHDDYFAIDDANEDTHQLIFVSNLGAPVINRSNTDWVVINRNAIELDKLVKTMSDTGLRTFLEWIIRIEWTEGCLIVEREISERRLNSDSVDNRFDL